MSGGKQFQTGGAAHDAIYEVKFNISLPAVCM